MLRVAHTIGVGGKQSGLVSGTTGISDAGCTSWNAWAYTKSTQARDPGSTGAAGEAETALRTHLRELGSAESRPEHYELVVWRVEVAHLSTHRTTPEEGRAASG